MLHLCLRVWHPDAVSLRQRLAVVIVLAAATLVAAVLALLHALASTNVARMRAAQATIDATNNALASAFVASGATTLAGADVNSLREHARALAGSLSDAHLGYCTSDGRLLAVATTEPRGEPRVEPRPLPPDQREVVTTACRGDLPDGRAALPHLHDVTLVAARKVATDGAVWTVQQVSTRGEDDPWKTYVAVLSTATALLVTVTITAMMALRRGFRQVQRAVAELREDLRAPVETPRSLEFAELTADLVSMAQHLADAREREGSLAKDLAHRERLAGLGRVVAGVAHEVRNPLAGIKLKLDVLMRTADVSERVHQDVRSCLAEVARLDRVVQSLLLVGRKSRAQPARVRLGAPIDARAREAEAEAENKMVTVERKGDGTAFVNHDDLVRVIDNLLRNAIEASSPGARVSVEVTPHETTVDVEVIDRGPGVPASNAALLFEPFFTTKASGTGLGLWLSRAVVESHGGELVYERRHETTVFRLSLPGGDVSA